MWKIMAKSSLLLLDLNETKTKKLAETITSDTSRKILNYLADKDHDTEKNISNELQLPISTVHYHLQKLVEAKLLEVEEFHYSVKGREINHYKLANKYIIIAPKKVSGLKQKLKGILPVALASVAISGIIKFVQMSKLRFFDAKMVATPLATESSDSLASATAEVSLEESARTIASSQPDIALWFLIGSLATILLYVLINLIREKLKKR
jgi:DNA-binding transcriptional ArsR family regulator